MGVMINSIFQVWRKDSLVCVKVNIVMKYSVLLQDISLQTFPCHTDSVWDLKLHNNTVVKHLNNQIFSNISKYFPPPGHSRAGRCGDPVRLCVGLRSESEVLYSGQSVSLGYFNGLLHDGVFYRSFFAKKYLDIKFDLHKLMEWRTRVLSCFVVVRPVVTVNLLQAHGDLVSAVDFNEDYLVTGYEDSNVGVWNMETGLQVSSVRIITPLEISLRSKICRDTTVESPVYRYSSTW